MKLKFLLPGFFVFALAALAAPHAWMLKTGEKIEGNYYSSGTTMVVVTRNGTNDLIKISDLAAGELPYLAEMKAAQRQARLAVEDYQMHEQGLVEFTKASLMIRNVQFLTQLLNTNQPSEIINQWGWLDASYLEPSTATFSIDGNSPPITASFCVRDKNRDRLDIYCLDAYRASLAPIIAGLKPGDQIRVIGKVLPAAGPMPAFQISKIEVIEPAAGQMAGTAAQPPPAEKPPAATK